MSKRTITFLACGLALTLAGSASPAPANGRIVFTSDSGGGADPEEIHVMNSDGSGDTRLTFDSSIDHSPDWSPDGTKIAFKSTRHGNHEIYVMGSDGSGVTRLTNDSATDDHPDWSPDGSKIAFYSARDGNNELYVMNADGSGQTRLTSNVFDDTSPVWSPDGTKIAFRSIRGNSDIYVINADGSGEMQLTTNVGFDDGPAWSPDGTKIAFRSEQAGNHDVYVMNADGSGQTQITTDVAFDFDPEWSPDGTKIAFASTRDGNHEIYVMNADGSGQTRLTNSTQDDDVPSWAPAPDMTPPVITFMVAGTLGLAGWYVSDVAVSWTVTDPDSPISSTSGCGPTTITTDTTGTTLTCMATSSGGTTSQSVTIKRDTTAPSLTVVNITVAATGPSGALVSSYGASATDNFDPTPTIVCTPSAPHTFPIGTTTVSCSATDDAGNSSPASFLVKVKGAAEQTADLKTSVQNASPPLKGVSPAILRLKLVLAADYIARGKIARACQKLSQFIATVAQKRAKLKPDLTAAQAAAFTAAANKIRAVLAC